MLPKICAGLADGLVKATQGDENRPPEAGRDAWLGTSSGAREFPHPWTPAPYRGTGHFFGSPELRVGGLFS